MAVGGRSGPQTEAQARVSWLSAQMSPGGNHHDDTKLCNKSCPTTAMARGIESSWSKTTDGKVCRRFRHTPLRGKAAPELRVRVRAWRG